MVHDIAARFVDKRSNLFIIFFLLIGCGNLPSKPKIVVIDPIFQPYVDDFIQASMDAGHPTVVDNLTIHFGSNLGDNILGECYSMNYGLDGTPMILIDPTHWSGLAVIQQEDLIFHEMGHCVLWLQHDSAYINTSQNDWIPRSIMDPFMIDPLTISKYWDYYRIELFRGPSYSVP